MCAGRPYRPRYHCAPPLHGAAYEVSVKSTSRNKGREGIYITIPNENFTKLAKACAAFGCEPYFSIVVDAAELINVFILEDTCMRELCPLRKKAAGWKMNKPALDKYAKDELIVKIT